MRVWTCLIFNYSVAESLGTWGNDVSCLRLHDLLRVGTIDAFLGTRHVHITAGTHEPKLRCLSPHASLKIR